MLHPLVRWLAVALSGSLAVVFAAVGLAYMNALRAVVLTRVTAPGHAEPGIVEIQARVRPAEETLTAPLSGEPCVGYVLRVERRGEGPRSLWGRRWRTTEVRSAFHAFHLVDGSGRVLVCPAPDGREEPVPWPGIPPDESFTDLELTVDERRVVEAGGTPPEGVDEQSPSTDRRYTEWRIDADDRLYVLGRARASEDPELPLVVENDGGPFVVSELPQWRVALRRSGRAVVFLVVAAALLAGAATWSGLL